MNDEVKTPYMMYKRELIVFKAVDGWMRTVVCLKTDPETDVEAVVSRLLEEAPGKHAKRRAHLEKVRAVLEETFPRRHEEWVLQRETCMRYELELSEWHRDVRDFDARKVAGLLKWDEELPPKPKCGCDYPLGPEPMKPEPLEPDTFTGTFKECVEEIQSLDLEAVGLKPIDVSEQSETFVFTEKEDV